MAREKNTKALAQQKRHRRQWLTFVRMCRYGVNNFSRNAWLTIAATAVMTLTLTTVQITVAAQHVLTDTTTTVARNIDRSIYLKTDTTKEQAQPIIDDLMKLSNVDSVKFISTEENKTNFAESNKTNHNTLNAITEATNQFPATLRINLKNPSDTSQLVNFVNTNQLLKTYISTDPNLQPSFMGNRGSATDTIAAWTRVAQEIGIGASVIFTAMSMLIIFNTIRMAIFNRRDEIEMMKLIGADKSFIRGPFVVEAIVYGFIAAVIATSVTFAIMMSIHDAAASWGVTIQPTITLYTAYIGFVLLATIVLGGVIGTVSSLLATRRYLKI